MYQLIITWYLLYAAPAFADLHLMQGEWRLTWANDGKPVEEYKQGVVVTIRENHFTTTDKDEHLQALFGKDNEVVLSRFGINPWRTPKKVYILWSEGIYEVSPDRLRFCVKYRGQGVSAEDARNWKAPVDFVVREGQEHEYWTFERVKK